MQKDMGEIPSLLVTTLSQWPEEKVIDFFVKVMEAQGIENVKISKDYDVSNTQDVKICSHYRKLVPTSGFIIVPRVESVGDVLCRHEICNFLMSSSHYKMFLTKEDLDMAVNIITHIWRCATVYVNNKRNMFICIEENFMSWRNSVPKIIGIGRMFELDPKYVNIVIGHTDKSDYISLMDILTKKECYEKYISFWSQFDGVWKVPELNYDPDGDGERFG